MTTKEQNQLTREAENGSIRENILPEFANSATAQRITGLCRSHLYALQNEGKIRSACLRKPGAIRGKRLWHMGSVISFLNSQIEG
jgi:hypothetical protein